MTAAPYPVRVTGRFDAGTSRALWLVKWLLLIPHLVLLAILGVAFTVVTVVAFFAILVTGRYPRVLFGFNAGVLRWGWRVAFYGYAANGTDRYPPFTLADVPDYPARLDIAYPERLSRGLVLVKWWLLAIPHYLVLAFLIGAGGTLVARIGTSGTLSFDGGLVTLLVLIGVVALLFTRRYPAGLFDFVVGMDRWVLRVLAYVSLMTDEYPPFRLDQGAEEQADEPVAPPGADRSAGLGGSTGTAVPAPTGTRQEAPAVTPPGSGRTVVIVVGAWIAALALGLVAAGAAGLVTDRVGRDAAGFVAAGTNSAVTSGNALRTEPIRIEAPTQPDVLAQVVGAVTLEATSNRGGDVFVGIGPASAVAGYLDGVATGVLRGPAASGAAVVGESGGGAPATPPAAQTFWAASAAGPGTRSLSWVPVSGTWTAVVMNADGSAPVDARVRAGAEIPVLGIASAAALGTGLGLLLLGVAVIAVGARPRRTPVGAS